MIKDFLNSFKYSGEKLPASQRVSVGRRNLWIDYAYMVMTVIYAGSGSDFVYSLSSWQNPVGLLIPVIFSVYLLIDRRITFSLSFKLLILGFVLYFIAVTLKFHAVHPRFFGMYLNYFFIAYTTISVFKQRFFIMYANVVFYLSIIALGFWVFQLFIQDAMINLFTPISISGKEQEHINILFYTIEQKEILANFKIPRNAGFAWEPGAFATFINLAIFSLFITNRFKVLGNIKFWVLLTALISTMSTTGYSTLMILILFYAYNQKTKYFVALIPVVVILIAYVSTLPFMADKLYEVSKYNTKQLIYNSVKWGFEYRPQRFESFQIDFIDFLNNPIIGYGGHNEVRWVLRAGAKISTVSGIGNLLAMFGIVGGIFFFYHLVNTSRDLARTFGYRGWFFHVVFIVMISISYALILTPLLMCFWLINSKFLTPIESLKFKLYSYLLALQK